MVNRASLEVRDEAHLINTLVGATWQQGGENWPSNLCQGDKIYQRKLEFLSLKKNQERLCVTVKMVG